MPHALGIKRFLFGGMNMMNKSLASQIRSQAFLLLDERKI
jgi:hypothetical protein